MPEAPSAANAVARGKVFAPELPVAPAERIQHHQPPQKAMFGIWEWGKR